MLKFYYAPISTNARRVWIALLEKQIPFESVILQLNGDHFQPEFTEINPLQRVPVIDDDGFRVVESLAILDYLEAKYPSPSLLPTEARAIATVRMVQMTTINELQPATMPLLKSLVQLEVPPDKLTAAKERVAIVLQFYENLLGEQPYFAGPDLSLAEVTAGPVLASLPFFGFDLATYPKLNALMDRLAQRTSWQQTNPSPIAIQKAMTHIRKILETRG